MISTVLCHVSYYPDSGYATNKAMRVSDWAWRRGYLRLPRLWFRSDLMIVLGLLFHGCDDHASVSVIGSSPALRSNGLGHLILSAVIAACTASVAHNGKRIMQKGDDYHTHSRKM